MAPPAGMNPQAVATAAAVVLLLSVVNGAAPAQDDLPRIYMVIVRGIPVVHYQGDVDGYPATAAPLHSDSSADFDNNVRNYVSYLIARHDELLDTVFPEAQYSKLYSYYHLVNGFALQITKKQADILRESPEVVHVEEDERVHTLTTHTPDYLGLPKECWPQLGGADNAGEGVVIGIVDTGIDPRHPSFQAAASTSSTSSYSKFTGKCEVAAEFPQGSCSGKLVGARHFAAAAVASGEFNASVHFASPLDADGHGTHTAATAAGKHGVPVLVNGFNFGNSSGMAPRARIAVYKALYRYIGGFFADVVAAIEQAVADGVDVLSLSVGPNGLPRRNLTFMSTFDIALLSAVKAGVFVTQAVGNGGPYPKTILSFSPWIFSVAAATHDRTYPNNIILGSNVTILGTGLAPGTNGNFALITAKDALLANASGDIDLDDECQDASSYDPDLVGGRILVCSYSVRFLFGVCTVSNVVATAKVLKATGIVLVVNPDLDGHTMPPLPIAYPAIVIPSSKDSSVLLEYYNTSTMRGDSGQVISSRATAMISGGQQAQYSFTAPKVATYSSRGPDVSSNAMDAADVLKPNILAPGNLIWAAWSPIGSDEREFQGETFAMISGTSMATPHIAGIAALVKQKNPRLGPAAIASALSTSATVVDANGLPLTAQHPSADIDALIGPATPFDFGAGFVNPRGAIDPGLVFDAGFDDYVRFLCSLSDLSNETILASTGSSCSSSDGPSFGSDLNAPYVSIAKLEGARTIVRTVTNVAANAEGYTVSLVVPAGVSASVSPQRLQLAPGDSAKVTLLVRALATSNSATCGSMKLEGDKHHSVHIPICINTKVATA